MLNLFCSESHLGLDAHDIGIGLARNVTITDKLENIVSGWGKRWDIPSDGSFVVISNGSGLVVVLVIEWGTVPVNVDMDVFEGSLVTKNTSEVQVEVRALHNWRWFVVGVVTIESELTGIVITLLVSNISKIIRGREKELVSRLKEALHKLLSRHLGEVFGSKQVNVQSRGISHSS